MSGAVLDAGLRGAGRGLGRSRPRGLLRRLARWIAQLWKLFLGSLLCLTPVTAVLVLGWLLRLMQRETEARWFARSHLARHGFPAFAAVDAAESGHESRAAWPNWVLRAGLRRHLARRWGRTPGFGAKLGLLGRALFHSLGWNLKLGAQSLVNLWVLTLPAAALWVFGWWGGWENSFNKGYEQFAVGPSVSLAGVAVFVLVMTYLPLALARQAATGDWKAFYDFRLVRRLIARRWLACLGLAALTALAGLPLFAAKGALIFIENIYPGFVELAPAEVVEFAKRYTFWATVYLFGAVIVLRLAAARIYAGAVLDALGAGALAADELGARECRILDRLGLLQVRPRALGHPVARAARWATGRVLRTAGGALTLALWFALAAQIFVGQFLNHVWLHWLNHPLVQLPWLRLIPGAD